MVHIAVAIYSFPLFIVIDSLYYVNVASLFIIGWFLNWLE